ncbi:MAG: hypothetical protein OXC01_18245 [Immundisolibacterales bacterium]|nr:hypothetical protein [Immundisolibacterales bacterium]
MNGRDSSVPIEDAPRSVSEPFSARVGPDAPEGAGLPVAYMQRTRAYYLALGYDNPYRWSHYRDVPFAALRKPLAESSVALVTTAAPYRPELGDQGPGAAYNGAAKFFEVYSAPAGPEAPPDVRISHVSYDRTHTTAKDPRTWFPLERLHEAQGARRIGRVAPRFHGLPTNRSQRTTLDQDCPALLRRVHEDEADAAILVAN